MLVKKASENLLKEGVKYVGRNAEEGTEAGNEQGVGSHQWPE